MALITGRILRRDRNNTIKILVVIASKYGLTYPRRRLYKRRCVPLIERSKTVTNKSNIQNTEEDLKILLRILSILNLFNISSQDLLHTRDYAFYAWTQIHTIRIRDHSSCRIIRQPSIQFGRAAFNPHLSSGVTILRTREYRLPGVEVSSHRAITIRGVFRGLVVQRRNAVYIYRGDGLWYRYRLVALASQVQEVES